MISAFELQQYLPFTVLKPTLRFLSYFIPVHELQQYLPFTVLKLFKLIIHVAFLISCNSTYRLRY